MTEKSRLDVVDRERLAQKRVAHQVDLSDRQIIGGAPVSIYPSQLIARKRLRTVVAAGLSIHGCIHGFVPG
jgi:hypothetical protein